METRGLEEGVLGRDGPKHSWTLAVGLGWQEQGVGIRPRQ